MTLESEEVRIKIMLRVIKFIDRFIEVFKLKNLVERGPVGFEEDDVPYAA